MVVTFFYLLFLLRRTRNQNGYELHPRITVSSGSTQALGYITLEFADYTFMKNFHQLFTSKWWVPVARWHKILQPT